MDALKATWTALCQSGTTIEFALAKTKTFYMEGLLYSMPDVFSTTNYTRAVNQRDVDICRMECFFRDEFTCDQ